MSVLLLTNATPQKHEHHKIAQSPSLLSKRNSLGTHTQKPEFFQCLFLVASIVLSESTNYSHFLCTLSLLSDLLNATQVQLSQHLFLFIFLFTFTFTTPLYFF